MIGNIVRFVNITPESSEASKFCCNKRITGKVVGLELGRYKVDVGFHYYVYVPESELEFVANLNEIPIETMI